MECYKGSSLENLARSIKIVSQHPSQVIILKSTREVIRLGSVLSTSRDSLVDPQQTRRFSRFSRLVERAIQGDRALSSQILEQGAAANIQLESIKNDAERLAQGIAMMAADFAYCAKTQPTV